MVKGSLSQKVHEHQLIVYSTFRHRFVQFNVLLHSMSLLQTKFIHVDVGGRSPKHFGGVNFEALASEEESSDAETQCNANHVVPPMKGRRYHGELDVDFFISE